MRGVEWFFLEKVICMCIIRSGSMSWLTWCTLFSIWTHIFRVIDENIRKMAKNGDLKTRIYGSKNISSCRAKNSEYSRVFRLASLSIYLKILMKMYEKNWISSNELKYSFIKWVNKMASSIKQYLHSLFESVTTANSSIVIHFQMTLLSPCPSHLTPCSILTYPLPSSSTW